MRRPIDALAYVHRASRAGAQAVRPYLRAPRRHARGADAPFSGIRLRLTLWYSAVLAVALALFGAALYAGIHQALFGPIDYRLATYATGLGARWQNCPTLACPRLRLTARLAPAATPYWVLYDANGAVIRPSPAALTTPGFMNPALYRAAARSSPARDVVDGGVDSSGAAVGAIERYAVAVPNPDGPGLLGVVQTGIRVQEELDAQRGFLLQLLTVGALTLAAAALGGLFLAHRALAPARLAFARQQRFIADASHELRTPLTLLRADAEVLLRGRGRLPPDDALLLDDIVDETAHMAALADNMLTLARLDAGSFHVEREVVDLADVAASVARRGAALAAEKEITLGVEDARPAPVLGDRALLEQAALILLDNAIKYNHPGGAVMLRACLDNGHARLEVRDTGPGIAPEHLARLGEPFYRVDEARSREAGGAGLGLAIARDIAAAHGGALTLVSAPERGTTAALALPAARLSPPAS